jgi:hypothetical protein
VTKILYLDLEESRRGALIGRLPKCFRGNSFLQKVVQHTAFQLTGDMVILINAICMIIYVSMHDTDPPCESAAFPIDCGIQSNLDNLEYGFVAFYILELLVRCLAWGAAALQSGWLWLDLIVVLTSITSIIVNTPAGISLASAVRLLRMLRLIRFLRIFFVLEKFKVILRTLAQIIPQLVSFFCFVLTMLYIFSVIAIWSFQCRSPLPPSLCVLMYSQVRVLHQHYRLRHAWRRPVAAISSSDCIELAGHHVPSHPADRHEGRVVVLHLLHPRHRLGPSQPHHLHDH